MKPKLRQVRSQPTVQDGQRGVLLSDPLRISRNTIFVPASLALLLALLDGTRDVGTLRTGFELRTGTPLSTSSIEQFISQLDGALYLENERFGAAYDSALNQYRSAASRPPALAGSCYPADADEARAYLQQFQEASPEDDYDPAGGIVGLVSPHIDFERGGHIYARVWAKARLALEEADLAVILGTDHNEGEGRITLTRQDYETPWGTVPTARDAVDEFLSEAGEGVFDCELNHRWEHSIETAVVWLHYLLGDKPCPVLPILCGSFQSFIEGAKSPQQSGEIASTIDVLRRLVKRQRTIVVAAADLAHVGPVFGDPLPLDFVAHARLAKQDGQLLDIMSQGQADEFLAEIRKDGDRRHVCGVPPIYVTMSVLSGATGVSLGYAQCPASEDETSVVSICGMLYQS